MNPTVLNRYLTSNTAILPAYTPDKFAVVSAVSITAEATLLTPTTGKRWRLLGCILSASAAGNILLRDNTAGTSIAIIPSAAGGFGTFVDFGHRGIASAATNNVLTAQLSVAGTVSGTLLYIEETI